MRYRTCPNMYVTIFTKTIFISKSTFQSEAEMFESRGLSFMDRGSTRHADQIKALSSRRRACRRHSKKKNPLHHHIERCVPSSFNFRNWVGGHKKLRILVSLLLSEKTTHLNFPVWWKTLGFKHSTIFGGSYPWVTKNVLTFSLLENKNNSWFRPSLQCLAFKSPPQGAIWGETFWSWQSM